MNIQKKPSKIITIFIIIIAFVAGCLVSPLISNIFTSKNPYDVQYKNLKKQSVSDQIKVYESKLNAQTSTGEVKYIMDKILPGLNAEQSDKVFSEYLNHLQYFMTTYNSLISIYAPIMLNERSTINFADATAVNKIDDNVLKSIISEIYSSNMYIEMPPVGSQNSPMVLANYQDLSKKYEKYMSNTTKEYMEFKKTTQSGDLTKSDGSIDKDKTEAFIIKTDQFISKYPQYSLLNDVIYSYIVASEMYTDIYNVSSDFTVSASDLTRYKSFVKAHPSTPLSSILNDMISKTEKKQKITTEDANNYIASLQTLLPSEDTTSSSDSSNNTSSNSTSSASSKAPSSSSGANSK